MQDQDKALFVKRLTRLSDTELAQVESMMQDQQKRFSMMRAGLGTPDGVDALLDEKMADTFRRKNLRRIYTQVTKLDEDSAAYFEGMGIRARSNDDVYAVGHIIRQPDQHRDGVTPHAVEGLITIFFVCEERMVCFDAGADGALGMLGACGLTGADNKSALRAALVEYDQECAKIEAVRAPHQSQALHECVNLLGAIIKRHFDRDDEMISLNVRDIVNGITNPMRYQAAIQNGLIP